MHAYNFYLLTHDTFYDKLLMHDIDVKKVAIL